MRYIVLFVLWISSAFGQAPGIDWQSQSVLGSTFEALSLREDGLGGVVAAGFTDVNFDYDVVVQNYSSSGAINWTTQIATAEDQQGTGITHRIGGYAVCGTSSLFGGQSDIVLHLLSNSGVLTNTFFYGNSDNESADDIQMTADFGFVMCGFAERATSGRDFHVVKTDFSGALQWARDYGGPADDAAHAILQTPDNGYIVVGETQSFGSGGSDMWILRLDANGDSLWSWALMSADEEAANGVALTNDGGFVVAGYTFDFVNQDVLLVKIASNGAFQWSAEFDNGGFDVAYDVDACSDGGLVVCGRSDASGFDDQVVWKFDEIGQHYWTVTTGGASGDNAFEVRQLTSGGYIYCGYVANPVAERIEWSVVKLLNDPPLDGPLPVELLDFSAHALTNGIRLDWETASETHVERFELTRNLNGENELVGTLAARGSEQSGARYQFVDEQALSGVRYAYLLTAVDLNGAREELRTVEGSWSATAALPTEFTMSAYPNPFNPSTTIEFTLPEAGNVTLSIWDNTGRMVESREFAANAGTSSYEWNAAGLPSGAYFARVNAAGELRVVQLVLLK